MSTTRSAPAVADREPVPPRIDQAVQFADPEHQPRLRRGAVTYSTWLPADSGWPVMDELRAEHHRHLRQIMGALGDLYEPITAASKADETYREAVEEAMRNGDPVPEDTRRSEEEVRADVDRLRVPVKAALAIFAEWLDEAIETIRAHEDEWRADLERQGKEAEEKAAEARRLAEHAARQEHHLRERAIWLQRTSEGLNLGEAREAADVLDAIDKDTFRR
jgi:hypothetical protein